MGWKKKEKEITPEEAVALIKKELAPYWYGSKPLICGSSSSGSDQVVLQPIDPSIVTGSWLIIIADPSDSSVKSASVFFKEFLKRYDHLGLHFLWVLRSKYQYIQKKSWVDQYIRKLQINCPLVVDHDGSLSAAFQVKELPKFAVLGSGNLVLQAEGVIKIQEAELQFQDYLRKDDPGLPLYPVLKLKPKTFLKDVERYEFGSKMSEKSKRFKVKISGNWEQEEDRIFTHDPEAKIEFECPSSHLAIVGQSLSKDHDLLNIQIDLVGASLTESMSGADLLRDEEGNSVAKVGLPQPLQVLANLVPGQRNVVLKFPHAKRGGIAIYGLRAEASV